MQQSCSYNNTTDNPYRSWQAPNGEFLLGLFPAGFKYLTGRILNVSLPPSVKEGPDGKFLDHIMQQALAALHKQISSEFALSVGFCDMTVQTRPGRDAGAVGYAFDVATEGETLLRIAMPSNILINARKCKLTNSPVKISDGARQVAINKQKVSLNAFMGDREITLKEARCLSPGDVIVLEQEVCQSVPVCVDNRLVPGVRARLIQEDQSLSITFNQVGTVPK